MTSNEDKKLDAKRIREKLGQFRILVIGPANAGKTTIAKKMCKTNEDPVIWNGRKRNLHASMMGGPSQDRGEHDIENEIRYLSNPGFVFHDSRGFESGGTDELEKVFKFIKERATKQELQERLHVIWYCVPMDSCRPLCTAERKFFENGIGDVPIILVFTKFDAFVSEDYQRLRGEGKSFVDAKREAPGRAEMRFQTEYLQHLNLESLKYKPKDKALLSNLHKSDMECGDLVDVTVKAVDDETLRHWFICLQQERIELKYKHCIQRALHFASKAKTMAIESLARGILEKILADFVDTISHTFVIQDNRRFFEFSEESEDELFNRSFNRFFERVLMPSLEPAVLELAQNRPPFYAALNVTIAMAIIIGNAFSSYHSDNVGWSKDVATARLKESLDMYRTHRSNLAIEIEEVFKDERWAFDQMGGIQSSEELDPELEKLCEKAYNFVMQYRLDKPQGDGENQRAAEMRKSDDVALNLASSSTGVVGTTMENNQGREGNIEEPSRANVEPSSNEGQMSGSAAEVKGGIDCTAVDAQGGGMAAPVERKKDGIGKRIGKWVKKKINT